MKGLILFPGFCFSYSVIDEAFSWAAEHHAALQAIWFDGKNKTDGGYLFPNDLKQTGEEETDVVSGENNKQQLFTDQLQMLKNRASNLGIAFGGIRLKTPDLNLILERAGNVGRVFVEQTHDTDLVLKDIIGLTAQELLSKID